MTPGLAPGNPLRLWQGHKLYVLGTTSLPEILQKELHLRMAFDSVLNVPTLSRREIMAVCSPSCTPVRRHGRTGRSTLLGSELLAYPWRRSAEFWVAGMYMYPVRVQGYLCWCKSKGTCTGTSTRVLVQQRASWLMVLMFSSWWKQVLNELAVVAHEEVEVAADALLSTVEGMGEQVQCAG